MNITTRLSHQCIACMRPSLNQTLPSSTVIPKRFRYYWDKRPQNRNRKLLMEITLPKLPRRTTQDVDMMEIEEDKLYGIDVVYQREIEEIFSKHRMVAVCLRTYMPSDDDYYRVRYNLQQHQMCMERYPEHVLEHTLRGTQFENLLVLCRTETALVYGEPNVGEMITAVAKNKHLLLLGGMIDGKMYSLEQLRDYSKLSPIDQLHGELCGTLSQLTASTSTLLQKHTHELCYTLQQHEKQMQEKGE